MDTLIVNNGAKVRERAQRHADLLHFMAQHAAPEVWEAMADLAPGAGPWVLGMNQRRVKRAATPAEAAEIVRLLRARYGLSNFPDIVIHGLRDPVWLLYNLRQMGEPMPEEVI